MDPEPETGSEKIAPDGELRAGVLAPDSAHHQTAGLPAYDVGHPQFSFAKLPNRTVLDADIEDHR